MILLIDIGNTHTHAALSTGRSVGRMQHFKTADLLAGRLDRDVKRWVGSRRVDGVCYCSVVPLADGRLLRLVGELFGCAVVPLNPGTLSGVAIDYPKPWSIGQDRLANAVAAVEHWGAPVVVVDFGTAVTFDVVDGRGCYVGGIIAPGLSAMTDYLHEKTALLPRVTIREPRRVIGRSTVEAMLAGAVHGYRGLVRALIGRLKEELAAGKVPVVATGGYASLIARGVPEILAVRPGLTLEGLRLTWLRQGGGGDGRQRSGPAQGIRRHSEASPLPDGAGKRRLRRGEPY